eukprot:COSAG01_NODE_3272_length_6321_cov_12.850530_2_plen_40_part_00
MAPPPRRSLPELGGLWGEFWGDGEAFEGCLACRCVAAAG